MKPRQRCKERNCNNEFFLSDSELRHYNRKWVANVSFSEPMYCEECRIKRRKHRRRLARSNFPIPEAEHGDGCFEELTISDIDEIRQRYGQSTLRISPPQTKKVVEDGTKRRIQYTLYSPSWLTRPTPIRVENPSLVKFSVDEEIAGITWLRNLPQGLTIWLLEYTSWAMNYPSSNLSLPFYAIAESIRQGQGGRILAKSDAYHMGFFASYGFQHTSDAEYLELSKEDAWRKVLFEHGVSKPVVEALIQQHSNRTADIAWIVEQIGRNSLMPQVIEAFTRLTSSLSWLDVKRLAIESNIIPDEEKISLRHRIREVVGTLKSRDLFNRLSGQVEYVDQIPAFYQVIHFQNNRAIKCYKFDPGSELMRCHFVQVQAGDKAILVTRMWSKEDYNIPNLENLYRQFDQTSDLTAYQFWAVSRNFYELSKTQQASISQSLAKRGVSLFIIYYLAGQAQNEVGELLNRLASNTSERFCNERIHLDR